MTDYLQIIPSDLTFDNKTTDLERLEKAVAVAEALRAYYLADKDLGQALKANQQCLVATQALANYKRKDGDAIEIEGEVV